MRTLALLLLVCLGCQSTRSRLTAEAAAVQDQPATARVAFTMESK